jgi:hypothetical protein
MADEAPRTPFTFHLHVAQFPEVVGVGHTPEVAERALERIILAACRAGDQPELADVHTAEDMAKAYPLTITAYSPDGVRQTLEGMLGRVRAARVLATLPGVL